MCKLFCFTASSLRERVENVQRVWGRNEPWILFLKSTRRIGSVTFGLLIWTLGCQGGLSALSELSSSNGPDQGSIVGSELDLQPDETSSGPQQAEPDATQSATCSSEGVLCLALRTVVFEDDQGRPTVSRDEMDRLVSGINSIWSSCRIAFQLDEYLAVNPSDYRLSYNTANYSDLTLIRQTFANSSTLLVVTTGPWDRSGSLGNTGANAWTSMPGQSNLGVVMEKSVGTYTPLVAHELGHYLNLDHLSASSSLMSPIIYSSSTQLSSSECATAEETVLNYWNRMIR